MLVFKPAMVYCDHFINFFLELNDVIISIDNIKRISSSLAIANDAKLTFTTYDKFYMLFIA